MKKNKKLGRIPDQSSNLITGKLNIFIKFFNRFIRRTGIDYYSWIKDPSFKKFYSEVINKENPLFFSIFDYQTIKKIDILKHYPFLILDLLKIKYILDIIHNEDYSFINDKAKEIK